ncbi:MAG: hypothetical protein N2316_04100 [Spirochaetes bacterium]|nr:hypothetical protein [Spirochaetota bacterium]
MKNNNKRIYAPLTIITIGIVCIGTIIISSILIAETPNPIDRSHKNDFLISQGIVGKISELRMTVDLADEAEAKGYKIKDIPQQVFTTFEVIAKGNTVAKLPVPLAGSTNEGVVYIHTILPSNAPRDGSNVYVWKNGTQLQIRRAAKADSVIDVQLPLDKGYNYLCFLVKSGNSWWGRSRVIRIESPGSEEKKDPAPIPVQDFWDEANAKGYNPPKKDSIIPFLSMTITSRGKIIAEIPNPLAGVTEQGVADSYLRLPSNLSGSNNSVFIWNNGETTPVSKLARSEQNVLSKVVLSRGYNYICAIVFDGQKYIGRSPMMRINSTVHASIARFEMVWDGPGDMDLHIDSPETGFHVCFSNTSIDYSGVRANLDVDNMAGFGPENIRIYSLPGKINVRCFVNYYSGGSNPIGVTVRFYDKNNKMIKTEHKTFSASDIRPTAQFTDKSWLAGTVTLEP